MRTIHTTNLVLLAGLIGFSVAVYPELPSQIPVHFSGSGDADEWAARTPMRWMLLPLVAAGICAVTYFAARISLRDPRRLNVPDRNKLLRLSHESQMWVLQGVANPIYLLAAVLNTTMCLLQYGAYLTATTGNGQSVILAGLMMALLAAPVMAVGLLISYQRRMGQAWRQHMATARV
jgi:uncharacterized membrane protein